MSVQKHGEGKRYEMVTVNPKKGKPYQRRQLVGTKPEETQPKVDDSWVEEYKKKFILNRYPVGIEKKDVTINTEDTDRHWVMTWTDPKSGRSVRAYTREFLKRNAQQKWERVKTLDAKKIEKIKKVTKSVLSDENQAPSTRQKAAIVYIIANTGLRIGTTSSLKDTGNRGVSTLNVGDIQVDGNTISFDFTGKSSKQNTAKIVDESLAKFINKLKENKKDNSRLFSVNRTSVMNYFRKDLGSNEYKLKDLRTYVATDKAREILFNEPLTLPEGATKRKKYLQSILTKVYEKVSEYLNNTPNMAKTSYIHPNIIDAWLVKVNGDAIMKSMNGSEAYSLDYIIKNFPYDSKENDIDEEDEIDEYLHPFWWEYGGLTSSRYKFYDKESLGKKREQMPQVDTDTIEEFRSKLEENGVKSNSVMMTIDNIKPTQGELNDKKVSDMIKKKYDWKSRIYLVSNDNYLLDGHHAYAVGLEDDPEQEVVAVKFDVDISELLKRANLMKMTSKVELNGKVLKGLQIVELTKHPFVEDSLRKSILEKHQGYNDGLSPVHLLYGLDVKKVWTKQDAIIEAQNKQISATILYATNSICKSVPFKQEVDIILSKFRKKLSLEKSVELDLYKTKNFDTKGMIGIKLEDKIYERKTKTFKTEIEFEEIIKAKESFDNNRVKEAFDKI